MHEQPASKLDGSGEQMKAIIDIQVRNLLRRLEDRKIYVSLTDPARPTALAVASPSPPTSGTNARPSWASCSGSATLWRGR